MLEGTMSNVAQHRSEAPGEGAYLDQGLAQLRDSGHKITRQRRAILELFDERRDHYTPADVFEALESEVPSLSLATVYNTLELLEEEGLVVRITARDGETYFDPTVEPHHHADCSECGEILDMEVDPKTLQALTRATKAMAHEAGDFSVTSATVWFEGRCEACRG